MTSLPRHLSCQLVRYCANWQFYWSVCAVLALTALFAVLDVQTISSTVSITANGTVQSHDALDPNLAHIVSDAMNASCGCCITGPIRSRSVTCSRPCSTA